MLEVRNLTKQYGELTNQTFLKKDGSNYIFKDEAGKEESFTPDEIIDAIKTADVEIQSFNESTEVAITAVDLIILPSLR